MINIFKKLKYQKLIKNKTKKLDFFLKQKKKKPIYFGIEPTSDSLHIGHLLGISLLIKFYKLGYPIIIILGGGSILINNLKFKLYKKKKKKILKKIKFNIKCLKKQIKLLFKKKKILILNNYKWLKKINLLKFFNNFLFFFSINKILKIKFFKKKIKKKKNIKFTDFFYHIIQGFDFFYLNKKYKCNFQIGGSDQWFNILTGIFFIKKFSKKKKVFGLTYPLLLNNNGIKFSKSNKENIWLNKKKTSIFDFYQFIINLSDNMSINYFLNFSNFNKKKIKKIIIYHKKNKKKKIIQKFLLKFFIQWIYGKKIYKEIKKIMYILFKKNKIKYIKNYFFLIKKYLKNILINKNKKKKITIFDLIKQNKKIFSSNNDYRKFIKNNGIFLINCKKNKNNILTNFNNLIFNKYLIIQKGKKFFFLLKII
ncbi:MAG: tyrosine--tRNA ligase [Candidatus Shikimatogenerans sp. JK-2022]|nr:tyrosine--tRNA ligase [Candidatus Shikimatogenerans bostrichidophilus]